MFERAMTAVLTHPAAMQLKRRIRNARWSVKGRGVRNPAVRGPVRSILFVCLGNICRSPFAARIAEQQASSGSTIRFASAGLRTTQAAASPREACAVAATYGISLVDHRPQQVSQELIHAHDMIVVMEAAQLQTLVAAYPEAVDRTFLLPLFDTRGPSGYGRYNIADPFSQPAAAYDECYQRITTAVRELLAAVQPS